VERFRDVDRDVDERELRFEEVLLVPVLLLLPAEAVPLFEVEPVPRRLEVLREMERERDGTFPPSRRASDKPIAIACFRLVTFFFDLPERSLPCFISSIDRRTFCEAFAPYRREPPVFLAAICLSPGAVLELVRQAAPEIFRNHSL
jgi:hypothetical protein